jgi:tRNA U34 5-carboxymethylaminomethyl modifying enzyme MnmG/GidA
MRSKPNCNACGRLGCILVLWRRPNSSAFLGSSIEREYTLADLLRRPEVRYDDLATLTAVDDSSLGGARGLAIRQVAEQVEISIKYAGLHCTPGR